MEKINIAELLKDCPKGMELDCTMYENVEFDYIESLETRYPIHCLMKTNDGYNTLVFTGNGCNDTHPNAKCVIFPKGKTTWEGFQRPFKDGDVVFYDDNIAIFKEWGDATFFRTYVKLYIHSESIDIDFPLFGKYVRKETRFATEKEKEKLFKAIKDNGYKWNPEIKTLEKLVEPKFKVGDRVLWNYNTEIPRTISKVQLTSKRGYVYWIECKGCSSGWWGETELTPIPNKFDISTLKPFESRVLVRDYDSHIWKPAIWGLKTDVIDYPYIVVGGISYCQCIPYEGNEHLLDTTTDCDEYYKTWE